MLSQDGKFPAITIQHLFWTAFFGYLAYCLYAGWSMRVLYPDGTIFFTYILEHAVPIHWHWDRQFAYYVQHAPLITAIKLGITDIQTLARIHATWYFSFGWLSLLVSYLSLPKEHKIYILFPIIWIFGLYIHVDFFPITPGRFITAIFWVVLFQIFFRNGWLSWLLVATVAWPLLRSYQGMIILGPILGLFALFKASLLWPNTLFVNKRIKNETQPSEIQYSANQASAQPGPVNYTNRGLSAIWIITALYFFAGAVLSFISILDPQDKASFLTFVLGFALFIDQYGYPSFSFLMGITTAILVVFRLLRPAGNHTLPSWFAGWPVFTFWILMSIMTVLTALFWHNAMAPETHQQLRSLNIYGTALLSFIVFIAVTTLKKGPWQALREYFLHLIAPASDLEMRYSETESHRDVRQNNLIDAGTPPTFGILDRILLQIGRFWNRGLPGLQDSRIWTIRVIAILVVIQLMWAFSSTYQWNRYLNILRTTLQESPSGLVLAQDTPLVQLPAYASISNGFHNDWDAPLMSILFAPDPGAVRTIIAHNYNNLYHPLDPRDLASLPDLSRYGFDLNPYIEAYLQQDPVHIPDMELPRFLQWLETQTTGINDFFERGK
jgi:hypothetical protein